MNDKLKKLAQYCGIRFGAFGEPIIDSEVYLKRFADEIIIYAGKVADEETAKPKKDQGKMSEVITKAFN
jgi:hypothetical protein